MNTHKLSILEKVMRSFLLNVFRKIHIGSVLGPLCLRKFSSLSSKKERFWNTYFLWNTSVGVLELLLHKWENKDADSLNKLD